MSDLVRVSFECEDCGGTVLAVEDHQTDASIVRCKTCGAPQGTFGDLKANAVRKALRIVLMEVEKALKE